MDASTFATGISVHRPTARATSYAPFARPAAKSVLEDDRQTRAAVRDAETLGALQELAFQYASERSAAAVDAVLARANANSYRHVLQFLESHRSGGSSFPELGAIPAAGVISGADAAAGDVWVAPLCQVLQRSFPLVLALPPDAPNARRVVESIAEQLDGVQLARKREERWLVREIDGFDLDSHAAHDQSAADKLARDAHLDQTPSMSTRSHDRRQSSTRQRANGLSDVSSASEASNDSSDDENRTNRKGTRGKKRRRISSRTAGSGSSAGGAAGTRRYAKWTMEQLLTKIWTDVNVFMTGQDPCQNWIAMLRDMILTYTKECVGSPTTDEAVVLKAIESCQLAVKWLMNRISTCRAETASKSSSLHSAINWRSTEFELALLLNEVLQLSLDFAQASIDLIRVNVNDSKRESDADKPAEESLFDVLDKWRRTVSTWIKRHESRYQLQRVSRLSSSGKDQPKPFLLLCIEQLEVFPPQLLEDFLEIWSHFTQTRRAIQLEASVAPSSWSSSGYMSIGLIVGVASAESPALRRLHVSVVSKINLQFFQLDDSLKCFDDIVETLVVRRNLPLGLSGDALRLLASRLRATQSIAVFLHALRFLLFVHFKRVPWSFVSHFIFARHRERPLDAVVDAPSASLISWLRRRQYVLPESGEPDLCAAYLAMFQHPSALVELQSILTRSVGSSNVTEEDWKPALTAELQRLTNHHTLWSTGWDCFRSACSWLEVELRGDDLVSHLALALDGHLASGPKLAQVVHRIATTDLDVLATLCECWRSHVVDAGVSRDDVEQVAKTLSELVLLCKFAQETMHDTDTKRMLAHLRQEIADVFVDELIVQFLRPIARSRSSKSKKDEHCWTLADLASIQPQDETVVEQLHFDYHDKLKELLVNSALEEEEDGKSASPTWLEDVGVAFLYYQENPGVHLRLREWADTFTDAVTDMEPLRAKSKKDEGETGAEIKARFLRAFCTLRHWGFVKSDIASDRDSVEKLVFI